MSWHGTVRCGDCYQKGHNKRSCPALKERMEKRLAADPDDYYAKNYFRKKEGAKKRTCTFCSEEGHNRATCPKIKEVTGEFNKANAHYQAEVARFFEAQDFRIGSLVEVPEVYVSGAGYIRDAVGIITKVNWGSVRVDQYENAPLCLNVRLVGAYNQNLEVSPAIDCEETALKWRNSRSVKVVSAGSGSVGDVPSTGALPKSTMKELLADDTHSQHYDYDSQEYVNASSLGLTCKNYWKEIEKAENKESK